MLQLPVEVVKMSPKGQLVVPRDIREELSLSSGEMFVAIKVKGGIFFRKVNIPDPRKEFEVLAEQVRKKFKKNGVEPKDVAEAVKWARKE